MRADRTTLHWKRFHLEAFIAGVNAYVTGQPISANPHIDSGEFRSLADNWDSGWKYAEQETRRIRANDGAEG